MTLIILAAIVFSATPVFEPARNHQWGEEFETALAVEAEQADSALDQEIVIDNRPGLPHQRYTFNVASPFEFVALSFESSRLNRIMYPLHLPVEEPYIEKPITDVPEKFLTVRSWLTEHLGEPDVFTSSLADHAADFEDVQSLLELDAYTFNYTWCSEAANAYLIAIRETGRSPVVLASVEAPHDIAKATRSGNKHVCDSTAGPPRAAISTKKSGG